MYSPRYTGFKGGEIVTPEVLGGEGNEVIYDLPVGSVFWGAAKTCGQPDYIIRPIALWGKIAHPYDEDDVVTCCHDAFTGEPVGWMSMAVVRNPFHLAMAIGEYGSEIRVQRAFYSEYPHNLPEERPAYEKAAQYRRDMGVDINSLVWKEPKDS